MSEYADKKAECSVALSYLLGSEVPIITAAGKGFVAKRIKEIAEKNGVEIVENSDLAKILVQQDIGSCIPPEVYGAVASIFAFLIRKGGRPAN